MVKVRKCAIFHFFFFYGTQLFPINSLSYWKVQITYRKKRLGFCKAIYAGHSLFNRITVKKVFFFKNGQTFNKMSRAISCEQRGESKHEERCFLKRAENWLWIDREATCCLPSKFCRNAQIPTIQWKVTRNGGRPFSNVAFSPSKLANLKYALLLAFTLCSRNLQNVKLRLDFVEVWSFSRHSDITWKPILANSKCSKKAIFGNFRDSEFWF